jgi:hypothetical protein
MPSRVFVPNQPLTFDRDAAVHVRKLDLTPAMTFGPLVFLLPDGEMQGAPEEVVARLRAGLADFTAEDYLLLTGDPRAQAWAAALAADLVDGDLKLLHWVRRAGRYQVVAVSLWPEEEASPEERLVRSFDNAGRNR